MTVGCSVLNGIATLVPSRLREYHRRQEKKKKEVPNGREECWYGQGIHEPTVGEAHMA